MERVSRLMGVFLFAFAVGVWGCVTVNIYFPAEKVESVAGEIVKDVRGDDVTPSTDDKSSQWKQRLLALFFSTAHAQEVTTVSNPTIRALKEKLKSNYQQMKPFYEKGMVREGNDGYVTAIQAEGLSLKDRRELNSLVDAENQHRRQLYAEVARALSIDPGQVNKVAEIFAREWQKSVR
jgi:uncharacterized protein